MGKKRNLLAKDLLARIPYGVIVQLTYTFSNETTDGEDVEAKQNCELLGIRRKDFFVNGVPVYDVFTDYGTFEIDQIKPYLRPMSAMTDDEKVEYQRQRVNANITRNPSLPVDYLCSIHVDFNDLIEAGIAIEVTKENNPYVH
jgi:hypothetical protein